MKSLKIAVLVTALSLCTGIANAGEDHSASRVPPGQGTGLSMTNFYAGQADHTKVGTFPGKLVCLRCDLGNDPDSMKQCAAEGHRHALSMDNGAMIHPLLPGTEEVLVLINSNELHGKNVLVHGNNYPFTGAILVDRITEVP